MPKILFFDTETTGVPKNYNAPVTDLENWPRVIQIAWLLSSDSENHEYQAIIKPDGFEIPQKAESIHGISTKSATENGLLLADVLEKFMGAVAVADIIAGHNVQFDINVMGAEILRAQKENVLSGKSIVCTMRAATDYCAIPGPYGNKWPKLSELCGKLEIELTGAHDAMADIQATAKCFFKLQELNIIQLGKSER